MSSGHGKQGTHDPEILVLALVVAAFFGFYYLMQHPQYFVGVWRGFLKPQVDFLFWLSNKSPDIFKWYSILVHNDPQDIHLVHQYIQVDNIHRLVNYVSPITRYIAKYYIPLYLLIFTPIAIRATVVMSKVEGKRGINSGPFLTFKSYLEYIKYLASRVPEMAFVNKQIKRVSEESIYKGSLRTADSPIQWCERLGVLERDEKNEIMTEFSIAQVEIIRSALVKDLGPRFKSLKKLENKYQSMIEHIYKLFPSQEILESAKKHAVDGHLYEYTVLLSLILYARRFGVLASSRFLGLKEKNRTLWYVIVSSGMNVAYTEAAAVVSQYRYELAIKDINKKRQAERLAIKKKLKLGTINTEQAHKRLAELKRIPPKPNQVRQAIKAIVESLKTDPAELPWKAQGLWDGFDPLA